MPDLLHAWETFWAIPHIRAWLTAGWILYLVWLGFEGVPPLRTDLFVAPGKPSPQGSLF